MSVLAIKKIRIATSIVIALILILTGYFLTQTDNLDSQTRNLIMIVSSILIILNLLIPIIYVVRLSKKGLKED